jgi:DNA polymerase I-like protein with 3'-5' exonuclease and polymerase domains
MKGVIIRSIDVETTSRCERDGMFAASPFYPDNHMLMAGITDWHVESGAISVNHYTYGSASIPFGDYIDKLFSPYREYPAITCGHNIVFDLHWLRRTAYEHTSWFDLKNANLWDTQVAAYILSGQRMRMASLDEVAAVWLPGEKDNQKHADVSEMIKAGKVEEVDREKLLAYMLQDVWLTARVAEKQMAHAKLTGQFELITLMCEHLKVIEEMEWNGMAVDAPAAERMRADLQRLSSRLAQGIDGSMATIVAGKLDDASTSLGRPVDIHTRMAIKEFVESGGLGLTPRVLSTMIFGGTLKVEYRVSAGYYMTGPRAGEPKYGKRELELYFKTPLVPNPSLVGSSPLATGWNSVDDSALKDVLEYGQSLRVRTSEQAIVLDIVAYERMLREVNKILNTYVAPMMILSSGTLHNSPTQASILHHRINPTSTRTGRLSSSDPNLQNVPMESSDPSSAYSMYPVKRLLASRWGMDGEIFEIDYKQLEVVALAAITRDPQLVHDLQHGEDIHNAGCMAVYGTPDPGKEKRRVVKTINFGLIYGGGAATVSKQAGVDLSMARAVIRAFYDRYGSIKDYYEKVVVPSCVYDKGTMDFTLSLPHISPRTFGIEMAKGKMEPSYTKLRNYPVQSLATGDFVPLMNVALYHAIRGNKGLVGVVRMVNTVHDSIVFDVHKAVRDEFLRTVNDVLKNAHAYVRAGLGADPFQGLPLAYEITSGPNWNEQEKVDIEAIA